MSKKQKPAPSLKGADSHAITRRQLIRGTAGGAALFAGGKWSTPVVQNVVLPAHAMTSITDPCKIQVEISGLLYQTTVSGNLFGAADKIGDVDGSVTLRYLNCFGDLLYDDTSPVTTASDGTYSVDIAQLEPNVAPVAVGGCPNTWIADIVALVNFPTVGQVECPAHVKSCPCL